MKYLTRIALLAALIFSSSLVAIAAGNTTFRWKDEQGNIVNSDRPPPSDIEYEVISTKSNMVRKVGANDGATPTKAEPGVDTEAKLVDSRRVVIEKNPELCEQARNNLVQLHSDAKIQVRDANGEVRFLSGEERNIEKVKAQSSIEAYCE